MLGSNLGLKALLHAVVALIKEQPHSNSTIKEGREGSRQAAPVEGRKANKGKREGREIDLLTLDSIQDERSHSFKKLSSLLICPIHGVGDENSQQIRAQRKAMLL